MGKVRVKYGDLDEEVVIGGCLCFSAGLFCR